MDEREKKVYKNIYKKLIFQNSKIMNEYQNEFFNL